MGLDACVHRRVHHGNRRNNPSSWRPPTCNGPIDCQDIALCHRNKTTTANLSTYRLILVHCLSVPSDRILFNALIFIHVCRLSSALCRPFHVIYRRVWKCRVGRTPCTLRRSELRRRSDAALHGGYPNGLLDRATECRTVASPQARTRYRLRLG